VDEAAEEGAADDSSGVAVSEQATLPPSTPPAFRHPLPPLLWPQFPFLRWPLSPSERCCPASPPPYPVRPLIRLRKDRRERRRWPSSLSLPYLDDPAGDTAVAAAVAA
jgi:hypothetical protein